MNDKRLATFDRTPMCTSISNSPVKFAEAGLERSPETVGTDEVICQSCGFTFRDWEGEKPATVHRTISPNCPFLNQTPEEKETSDGRSLQELQALRRQLFLPLYTGTTVSGSDTRSSVRSIRSLVVRLPFKPIGGFSMLFASIRQLTFLLLNIPLERCKEWADNGFFYREELADFQCVFCGMVTKCDVNRQPKTVHEELYPSCPFINHVDVGNITVKEERDIRQKYLSQACEAANGTAAVSWSTPMKYQGYKHGEKRMQSFVDLTWPCIMLQAGFTPERMSIAGFFYTGAGDAVRCFHCGIGLLNWKTGADPLTQHALQSPECFFIRKTLGEEAVKRCSDIETMTEAVLPGQPIGESNVILTQEGVSSDEIDHDAVIAAREANYSFEQICRALLGFLQRTRRHPCKEALLAALKADHELTSTLTQQEQVIRMKEQEKAQAVQEKAQAVQEKAQAVAHAVQEKAQAVAQAVQEKAQAVAHAVQEKAQAVQEKEEEKQQVLREKEEKENIIQELLDEQRRQAILIQDLAQRLRIEHAGGNASTPEAAISTEDHAENHEFTDEFLCKFCCYAKADIAFLPCGHFLSCTQCVDKLADPRHCPYCRKWITDTKKIYAV